jgi:hypothetical protein
MEFWNSGGVAGAGVLFFTREKMFRDPSFFQISREALDLKFIT